MTAKADWDSTEKGGFEYDMRGTYIQGIGMGGQVPVLKKAGNTDYTIKMDQDGSGALHTLYVTSNGQSRHRKTLFAIKTCPSEGCWPPPQPSRSLAETDFSPWSMPQTWYNTTDSTANPLNVLKVDAAKSTFGKTMYEFIEKQEWEASTPSAFDNVWIPAWKRVVLDVNPPILNRLVVEGTLVINNTNASAAYELIATWIEIKGGTLIIARCDGEGNVVGPFDGRVTVSSIRAFLRIPLLHMF